MSNSIKNSVAIEIYEQELDAVAGGFTISLGDGQTLKLDTDSSFHQSNLTVGQSTFAGPKGAGTVTLVNVQDIFSKAGQGLTAGN